MFDLEQMKKDYEIAIDMAKETSTELSKTTLRYQKAQWELEYQRVAHILKAGDAGINEYELTLALEKERTALHDALVDQHTASLQNHLAELSLKQVEFNLELEKVSHH